MRCRVLPMVACAAMLTLGAAAAGDDAAVVITSIDAGAFPEILVHARVVDASGRTIAGLPRSGFTLFEDGQEVENLRTTLVYPGERTGLGVVLAIDSSGSMRGTAIEAAKAAATAFLRQLSPQDRVALVTFGDEVTRHTGSAVGEAVAGLRAEDQTTHLWDGVAESARLASRMGTDRHAVVVLTDGRDEGSASSLDALIRSLPNQVSVHVIGLRSPSFLAGPVQRLARQAGGTYREAAAPADLLALYRRLARELRSDYLLRYTTTEGPDVPREVIVTVNLPTGPVTASSEYAPPEASSAEPVETSDSPPWLWIALAAAVIGVALLLSVLLLTRRSRSSRAPAVAAAWPDVPPGSGVVVAGPYLVAGLHQFPLSGTDVVIGRDPAVGIRLDDPRVSRVHARIHLGLEGSIVEDLSSANGTFVNGEQVTAALLTDGDTVRFGDTEFLFRGGFA